MAKLRQVNNTSMAIDDPLLYHYLRLISDDNTISVAKFFDNLGEMETILMGKVEYPDDLGDFNFINFTLDKVQ